MYQGTTIDELMDIVARAEQHARELQMQAGEAVVEDLTPHFVYQMPRSQSVMVGVA